MAYAVFTQAFTPPNALPFITAYAGKTYHSYQDLVILKLCVIEYTEK